MLLMYAPIILEILITVKSYLFIGILGDIEEFPALDPIPVYPVNVDPTTDEVKITIKSTNILSKNQGRIKTLCKASEDSSEVVVIIGSGSVLIYLLIRYDRKMVFIDDEQVLLDTAVPKL